MRAAILLAVKYTRGVSLCGGIVSEGCFSCLALRTILSALLTGHRSGWALSDDNVIVWPISAILLDKPGDPNGVGYLKRRVINCVYLAPRFVEEGKFFCGKCFYDLVARRVSVVIDL
jgi:hypothetical protein